MLLSPKQLLMVFCAEKFCAYEWPTLLSTWNMQVDYYYYQRKMRISSKTYNLLKNEQYVHISPGNLDILLLLWQYGK